MAIIDTGFEQTYKKNDDPVTTGDLTVNTILQEELTNKYPEIGWLSEETKDNDKRLKKERVWIVDPIDGTKEFVMQIPEFSISVALVENGFPLLGVVHNPLRKETYSAIRGKGAFLNGKPIYVKSILSPRPKILASRSEIKRGEWEIFKTDSEVIPAGSIAYKLALVAAGEVDATFSLGPKNEWDIAAGCLIIEEAGGKASDKNGQGFVFNQKDTLVDSIVGTSAVATEQIFKLIKEAMNNV